MFLFTKLLLLALFQFKGRNKVAATAVVNNEIFSERLQDEATIFTAEAKAIELAFKYMRISKKYPFYNIS